AQQKPNSTSDNSGTAQTSSNSSVMPQSNTSAFGRTHVTAPGSPETQLHDSSPHGWSRLTVLLAVVGVLELDRRHVPDRRQQATGVEPVDPRERRELHGLDVAPRALPPDHLRLVKSWSLRPRRGSLS